MVTGVNASLTSISPDGKFLLYGYEDIIVLTIKGPREIQPLAKKPFREGNGRFSPDGRWIAHFSYETGRQEVYVQGFPDIRGKWLVSPAGGRFPQWRSNGKELFWIRPDNMLMGTKLELEANGVQIGQTEALFRLPIPTAYAPAADGKRFLTLEPESEQEELPMVVVQNWAARLAK